MIAKIEIKECFAGARLRNSFFKLMIAFIGMLCLTGCRRAEAPLYSSYAIISPDGWDKSEIAEFDPGDTGLRQNAKVDVIIGLRYAATYPYEKLWLKVERFSNASDAVADTIAIQLTDASGQWRGRGWHGLHELSDTLWRDMRIEDVSHVEISQVMRDMSLPGIYNVGLIIK